MTVFPFYIIMTPGSTRYLKFAVWSLSRRTDMSLSLVSNGLEKKEVEDLHAFCKQIDAPLLQLPTNRVVRHGEALNMLLEQHQQSWFCFCDADIVSTTPTANDIPFSSDLTALSSCEAMFWDNKPTKGVLGRCNQWPDGSQHLSSFFCIYETQTLKTLQQKHQLGFENIHPEDIQSLPVRALLKRKGVNFAATTKLDTGKALTAAMEVENFNYAHRVIPSLLHIGGLSSWILNGDKRLVYSQYHLTDKELYTLAPKGSWLYNPKSELDEDLSSFLLRRQQRLAAARYCFQLISHYVDGTSKPSYDLSDKNLVNALKVIEKALQNYHHKEGWV